MLFVCIRVIGRFADFCLLAACLETTAGFFLSQNEIKSASCLPCELLHCMARQSYVRISDPWRHFRYTVYLRVGLQEGCSSVKRSSLFWVESHSFLLTLMGKMRLRPLEEKEWYKY